MNALLTPASIEAFAAACARAAELGERQVREHRESEERGAKGEMNIAAMVADPRRITRAIYGLGHFYWPVPGKTSADMLADCRRYLANQESLAAEGHWAYARHNWLSLLWAEAALVRLGVECPEVA